MPMPWEEIIAFWKEADSKKWFAKDDDFDKEIIDRFSAVYHAAASGELDHWTEDPDGALGLILVLDQFSRNMFRNSPRAFAADAKALEIARLAVAHDYGDKVDEELRAFLFMPFMHSEDMDDQSQSLRLQTKFGGQGNIDAAKWHREIIERFGRFPHRNPVLGRKMTTEEQAYLDEGGFKG